MRWLIGLFVLGLMAWRGRHLPLGGRRKSLVRGLRLTVLVALGMAVWGPPLRRLHALPRQLIYVVDHSESLEAVQAAWIARRISSLESLRPSGMARAVVVFGSDAKVAVPWGRERLVDPGAVERAVAEAGVARDQTNLELGLLSALAVPPRDEPPGDAVSQARTAVVLLSDGQETAGNVTAILGSLRRLGLEVFPEPPPLVGRVPVVWDRLVVPPAVQRGSPVPLQLVVFNGAGRAQRAYVTVSLHGVDLKREAISVRPGWGVAELSIPLAGRGTMALDVELAIPEARLREHRRAYTDVEGPPAVLFVGESLATRPPLAAALQRRDMELVMARLADLPVEASRLLDYDAVVLFNVPKSQVAAVQAQALRRYVEEFGGGLVMVGLGGDLAYEVEHPAPVDSLLPVVFEPKGLQEAKRRVCMILLIDRSASMLGPQLAATKRAAVELVKQLAPEDLVGILAFDTKAYVIAEVQSAEQVRARLVEKLVTLRSIGNTEAYAAFAAAHNRLELTGATLKHILLLSDGNTPFHGETYRPLLQSFKQSGTTISTIGIGSAFINTAYLAWLAQSTGGTFYQLRDLEELPRLIARDTQHTLERLPFAEGYFRPQQTAVSEWFPDPREWPPLSGYFTATARPAARVDLAIDRGDRPPASQAEALAAIPVEPEGGLAQAAHAVERVLPAEEHPSHDPLLARWWLGHGRVVVFTSDADRRWSAPWIRWPGFEGTWAQVIRWAMRPRLAEEVVVRMEARQGIPQLVLEGVLNDPRAEPTDADEQQVVPVSLVQTGAWRWHASLEDIPSGWYHLVLSSQVPAGSTGAPPAHAAAAQAASTGTTMPVFARRWVQVGAPSAVRETIGQPPREALLRQVAEGTSGVYGMPDRALVPPTVTRPVTVSLLWWWLPVAVVALLIEIALRGSSML